MTLLVLRILFVVGTISSAVVAAPAGPPTAPSIRTLSTTKAPYLSVPSQLSARSTGQALSARASKLSAEAIPAATGEDNRDHSDERQWGLEVDDSHRLRNGDTIRNSVPGVSSGLATSKLGRRSPQGNQGWKNLGQSELRKAKINEQDAADSLEQFHNADWSNPQTLERHHMDSRASIAEAGKNKHRAKQAYKTSDMNAHK
ncbi:hypothetical protein C8R42DRAFT_440758 [Lentinula raphanica]|nr:hypothetical protein C8R42DRAFT_440758 [Lentinula raphanica]